MLRLILDGTEVDLYENESVNLTLQFADVQNINSSTGSFSQTFRLPATDNNLDFFGPIDRASGVGVKNPKERIPAELVSGTTPILRGFCQIKAIYLQKEKYADIEVVFFSGAVDLRSQLAGKMLTDLNLSSYDHTLTKANIQASWVGLGIGPEVRYGLIDKGFNWHGTTNPPWTSSDGLWQGQLTPFIQVKVIFDAIMDAASFTYDSDFFDTTGAGNFDAVYMPCFNGLSSLRAEDEADQTAAAGLASDLSGTYALNPLALVDTVNNGKDPSDNWANAGNHKYTCPYTGYYKLRFYCNWEKSDPSHFVKVYLYKNGVSIATLVDTTETSATYSGFPAFTNSGQRTWDDVTWSGGANGGVLDNTYVLGQGFLFESGDEIAIYRQTNGITAKIYGGDGGTAQVGAWDTTSLEIFEVSDPLSGQQIDVANNLPELSQIDFVLGIQRMFNLVLVPDNHKPDHLIIEPFNDYTSTGTAKDWTNKVDFSKDVTLTPTTDLQSNEYAWQYSPGLDFISDAIQRNADRVYGRFRVLDAENAFATGKKDITPPFGGYVTSLIPDTIQPIHRSLKADGTIIDKPKAMIAYWHGTSTQFGTWYLREDDGTTSTGLTLFPSFSNFSTDFATVGDKDLNFGMEAPFFPIEANPANTLYFEYWAQYVTELYSEEARLLKCTIRLTRQDLNDFEFSDRIYIRDSYYRVLKLSYDANVEGVCSVELIKELSDIEVCADVPTGFDDRQNVITFNNSGTDYGSRTCCELYGYSWVQFEDGGVGYQRCKPRQQTNQPT